MPPLVVLPAEREGVLDPYEHLLAHDSGACEGRDVRWHVHHCEPRVYRAAFLQMGHGRAQRRVQELLELRLVFELVVVDNEAVHKA